MWIMLEHVRQSQLRAWLEAQFPDPTEEITYAINDLVARDGSRYRYSEFLDVQFYAVWDQDVDTARPYADTGALLLDEQGPADWRQKIDVTALDLSDALTCVLGQLYGHYTTGIKELRYRHCETDEEREAEREARSDATWMAHRGFDVLITGTPRTTYYGLTLAWRELLAS